jgi:hypothetical protein
VRAVKAETLLIAFFHEPLYFRSLHTSDGLEGKASVGDVPLR